MPKFSSEYQQSHDIDWFAKIGNVYVHAMSFGGNLPNEVNERYTNTQVLLQAYRMERICEQFVFNEAYITERLAGVGMEAYNNKRERYLRHFKEMASRGFYSFDRDLHEENVYHLIVRPTDNNINARFPEMPHLAKDKMIEVDGTNYILVL